MVPHLMTILDVKHYRGNDIIWQNHNIPNTFHKYGEDFLLSVAFDTDGGYSIPTNYYVGLDNRTSIDYSDDIGLITNEPNTNGYGRQAVSSATGFSVAFTSGRMRATSGILTFSASGGSWGPVSNAFLATSIDGSGVLISSTALGSTRTLTSGEYITIRFGLSFQSC